MCVYICRNLPSKDERPKCTFITNTHRHDTNRNETKNEDRTRESIDNRDLRSSFRIIHCSFRAFLCLSFVTFLSLSVFSFTLSRSNPKSVIHTYQLIYTLTFILTIFFGLSIYMTLDKYTFFGGVCWHWQTLDSNQMWRSYIAIDWLEAIRRLHWLNYKKRLRETRIRANQQSPIFNDEHFDL